MAAKSAKGPARQSRNQIPAGQEDRAEAQRAQREKILQLAVKQWFSRRACRIEQI